MSTESISQMIQDRSQRFGPKLALCQHGGNPGERYTYRELDDASGRLAAGFVDLGLQPGDRLAILCESRPRWGVVFFAAIRAGAVVVPLDTRQTVGELSATLANARPVFLLVSAGHEPTVRQLARDHRGIRVLSVEPAAAGPGLPSMDAIATTDSHACIRRSPDDAAVVTYTSGTMGTSKGVVTTHGNLLHQIRSFRRVMANDSHCTVLSVLPLSHLFELTVGFLGVLHGGGRICYCNSLLPHEIAAAMCAEQVTCMVTVPLFLKLFAGAIRDEIDRRPAFGRAAFDALSRISAFMPMALRRRLFRRLHCRFGGRLEYFVCGGAPLDPATLRFFVSIGLPVYQGYGLAETSPVITANRPAANRDGSVGKPLPGVELRIGDNGEILTRGPHVMRGYFNDDKLTASVIDTEGWLHTGDIGYLDQDGFLFVCGREKNVIVLGSGEKVQAEELEEILFDHPDIAEGCVMGVTCRRGLLKDTEAVCAVAVPSDAAFRRCAARSEDPGDLVRRIIEHQALRIAPGKRPSCIVLRTEPLPRTSARKIRRREIRDWLAGEAVPI